MAQLDEAVTSQLKAFLQAVVTTPSGYMELGVRNGQWAQHWYDYPNQLDEIVEHALSAEGDVYFTAHLFGSKDSHKENVLPGRTIQADLDNADTAGLSLQPTVLNQTSPGRHQGFWVVASDFDSLKHQEELSKRLTYSIPLCDHSGWSLGHKVRVPFTRNYKYKQEPQGYPVQILKQTSKLYKVDELELLPPPAVYGPQAPEEAAQFIIQPPALHKSGAFSIVESIKDHLSAKVYAEYLQDTPSQDRSLSLFQLEVQCYKAGLSREEVFWVAYNSVNNKFKQDLRYNHERELAKHVLVAEAVVKSLASDIKSIINEIRKKTKVLQSERRRNIYEVVLRDLQQGGDFVHVQDDRRYYVPRDTGRPIELEMSMGSQMHDVLDIKYGLNRTEPEHSFTMSSLTSYTGTLPDTAACSVLSSYDHTSRMCLVHGGRKDVHVVSASGLSTASNGTYSVLFPWDRIIEPFLPTYDPDIDWASELFTIPNTEGFSAEEAKIVLKVWVLFSLLRDAATSRPILAFFGQPGSGKTSTARKLYAFFYGRHMDVSGATSPVNYDIATASLPFYVLDNLDTWEKWIPDRLAQSAGKSDVIVRKLYTNNQTVRIKRQAMVAVTAHDPKFGRADVTDRMLIINLQRFSNVGIQFQDEGTILSRVIELRNKLWGNVLHDLQRVLATPMPATTDLQLRIQDYARLGEWIAIALGSTEHELFREAVGSLTAAQRAFNMDEDHVLITSLQRWLAKSGGGERTQDQLYKEVSSYVAAEDIKTFLLLYKNSSVFCKRISNLQDTLNAGPFQVDISINPSGQRIWKIEAAK